MKPVTVEILSQGDEVITGDVVDTNAAWLSEQMTRLGFHVMRRHTIGDRLYDLTRILGEIAERADICLCTGGLGPTCDDLTAEAVSLAFGRPLQLDPEALAQIRGWFNHAQRPMPEINARQAMLPEGATRMDNDWGTAPGFILTAGRCRFYFMPGVPREMKALFSERIEPQLKNTTIPQRRVILHTVGIGESALQERLAGINLPKGVILGFRAGGAENQVKLIFPNLSCNTADMEASICEVAEAIGPSLFAVHHSGETDRDSDPLVTAVGLTLPPLFSRLFVVETLSGGRLAQRCSSQTWFSGGWIEPNPARLVDHWLDANTPLSAEETARQLATHIREERATDIVLVQYIDPTVASLHSGNSRIDMHIALATAQVTHVEIRSASGLLNQKQAAAASCSLDVLRRLNLAHIR